MEVLRIIQIIIMMMITRNPGEKLKETDREREKKNLLHHQHFLIIANFCFDGTQGRKAILCFASIMGWLSRFESNLFFLLIQFWSLQFFSLI